MAFPVQHRVWDETTTGLFVPTLSHVQISLKQ